MSAPKLVGTVWKLLGKVASVRVEAAGAESDGDGGELRSYECYLRGRLFDDDLAGSDVGNQIAVGDRVELTPLDEEEAGPDATPPRGVIESVLERRTALVRRVVQGKGLQVIAANLDQLVVVSALRKPRYRKGLIDRYLVIAHHAGIAPVIVLNKIDLGSGAELDEAEEALGIYRELGYPLVATSAKTGRGLDELATLMRDRRSALTGHSGVGKSKLASALGLALARALTSGEVDRRGRGRHTTSAATLVPLEGGGEVVDTPGVRELSIQHVPREELAGCFPELRPHLNRCRFSSCRHVNEPEAGCAVKTAVAAGEVARGRYESFLRFYEELGAGS